MKCFLFIPEMSLYANGLITCSLAGGVFLEQLSGCFLGSRSTWKQKVTTDKTSGCCSLGPGGWLSLCFLDCGDGRSSPHCNLKLCQSKFSPLGFPAPCSHSLWAWYGQALEVRAAGLSCRRLSELRLRAFSHGREKSYLGPQDPSLMVKDCWSEDVGHFALVVCVSLSDPNLLQWFIKLDLLLWSAVGVLPGARRHLFMCSQGKANTTF